MADSLSIQSAMAAEFIASAWPKIRAMGRERIYPWRSEIDEVILCGCGDSHHAALSLELAFAWWSNRRARAASSMMAARYLMPGFGSSADRTLVIGISASGEVARTREAIELGAAFGARTLALTSSKNSPLAKAAQSALSFQMPEIPPGPGLLSYLTSLLMGLSTVMALGSSPRTQELEQYLSRVPDFLQAWQAKQAETGRQLAKETPHEAVIFLGSGPAYGSALFSAAKVVEATGATSWGQDVEEWSHLEYFCEPPGMPTWILSSGGRSIGREQEVVEAAKKIGRRVVTSSWTGKVGWSSEAAETLAPLALWIGPVAYASHRAQLIDEKPFRDFGGGRSRTEGGGASRIRSSARVSPDDALSNWTN